MTTPHPSSPAPRTPSASWTPWIVIAVVLGVLVAGPALLWGVVGLGVHGATTMSFPPPAPAAEWAGRTCEASVELGLTLRQLGDALEAETTGGAWVGAQSQVARRSSDVARLLHEVEAALASSPADGTTTEPITTAVRPDLIRTYSSVVLALAATTRATMATSESEYTAAARLALIRTRSAWESGRAYDQALQAALAAAGPEFRWVGMPALGCGTVQETQWSTDRVGVRYSPVTSGRT